MPMTPDDVLSFLADHGIAVRTYTHPPVHTVAESQALRGDIPGAHTKNLFLRDGKKTYFLVTLEENTPVDLKGLRARIGARGGLSFASAEALMEHLGVLPGSVSLLALVNDTDKRVQVVIDASLLAAPLVNCHPLTNEKTTSLAPAQLQAFLSASGHEATLIEMDSPPPPV